MILTPILKASWLALRRADEALPGRASEEAGARSGAKRAIL
jgi:hypothetical protein